MARPKDTETDGKIMAYLGDIASARFLVVEDETVTRELVCAFLNRGKAGDTLQAASLQEAKSKLASAAVNCVVCDQQLGDGQGLELLKAVRAAQVASVDPNLPFIVLTGHGEEAIIRAALELDVSAYLMKPISQNQLLQCVEKALERRAPVQGPGRYAEVELPA